MRHPLRFVVVLAVALLMVLTGCGVPAGLDGSITDDWPAVAAPTGFTPEAGTCHAGGFTETGARSAYEQVDCDESHRTETISVGRFTDGTAVPPAKGSAEAKTAYADCNTTADAYVGGPWHTAQLWLGVVQPTVAAWAGGARWYRCELLQISSIEDDGDLVARAGSLKGALSSPSSPLRLTCYGVVVDSKGAIDTMPSAPCSGAHNAEFVGVWTSPEVGYPRTDADWAVFHRGCRGLIAAFAGVPNDKNLEFRTGVVSLPGGEDVWASGDRTVRCYLWVDGAKFTGSLKGRGEKALPIQYK